MFWTIPLHIIDRIERVSAHRTMDSRLELQCLNHSHLSWGSQHGTPLHTSGCASGLQFFFIAIVPILYSQWLKSVSCSISSNNSFGYFESGYKFFKILVPMPLAVLCKLLLYYSFDNVLWLSGWILGQFSCLVYIMGMSWD